MSLKWETTSVRTSADKVISFRGLSHDLPLAMVMSPDSAKRVIAFVSHTSGMAEMRQEDNHIRVLCVSGTGSAWGHVGLLKTAASCSAHTCIKWRINWICLSVLFIFAAGWQVLIKFSIEILRWMLCGYLSFVSVGPVWILIYMELNSSFAWFNFLENNPYYEVLYVTNNTDLVSTYSFYWNTLRCVRYYGHAV